ncbi:MAG: ABC transporter permease subunit [Propionibacteriales bacterium]|nr:ABC transporter permease subunit [Propionibacteriales bacterium]
MTTPVESPEQVAALRSPVEPPEQGRRRRWVPRDPRTFVFLAVAAILVWEIAIPLIILLWGSVSSARPGSDEFFSPSSFTLDNFARAFDGGRLTGVLWDTFVFATGTTVLAFILGTYLAWVCERTNTPLRGFITLMMVLRLILPGILTTISWIFLASPNIGTLNRWLQALFGLQEAPLNIYSMAGMIWVETMDILPLVFLLMSAALRSMDPSLEEASLVAGKGLLRTTGRITLPLIRPAILATLILLLIRGIETFETPALIGIPAQKFTFVVEIWRQTSTTPTDFGVAAVFAVLILAFCSCLLWLYNHMTRHADAFAVVTGKAFRPRRTDLGAMKWGTLAGSLLICLFSLGLPMIILVWASFYPPSRGFQPITADGFALLSWDNYRAVLDSDLVQRAFVNSTFLGIASAAVVVLLMTVVAWITVKTSIPGRMWLDHLSFAPIAIPAVAMGVAFLWLYLSVPIPVYGTIWILFLLYVARFTAVALRIMSASMTQVSDELHEAAEVAGASWWRSFRTVTMPLLRPGMLAAFIFVLVHAYRELSASLLVYSYGNEPIGVAVFDIWENGSYGLLSAFGILVVLALAFFSIIARVISNRYGVKEEQ